MDKKSIPLPTHHTFIKIIILCLLLILTNKIIVSQSLDKERILSSISQASDYACNVLLDESGKSRCDYDWTSGKWHVYESAWHTGQIIWALNETFHLTKDSSLLQRAIQAGQWWKSLQIKSPGKLSGFMAALHEGDIENHYINFTTIADGTPGIFALSRTTGDVTYANVATEAGDWAVKNLYLPDKGVLYDIIDIRNGDVLTKTSPHYEGDDLPLHLVTRPNNEGFLFGDMYLHTHNKLYLDVFRNLCNSLVEKQSPNGFWMDYHPNNVRQNKIHPRFNIWYAESLIKGFDIIGDSAYLTTALNTARAITRWQQKDGTIYYTNRPNGTFDKSSICGSAVAFAGILWLKLFKLGYTEFEPFIHKSANFIIQNQFPIDHPDPNLQGAYFETWTKSDQGKTKVYIRDIATAFGLRFMVDYYMTFYMADK